MSGECVNILAKSLKTSGDGDILRKLKEKYNKIKDEINKIKDEITKEARDTVKTQKSDQDDKRMIEAKNTKLEELKKRMKNHEEMIKDLIKTNIEIIDEEPQKECNYFLINENGLNNENENSLINENGELNIEILESILNLTKDHDKKKISEGGSKHKSRRRRRKSGKKSRKSKKSRKTRRRKSKKSRKTRRRRR